MAAERRVILKVEMTEAQANKLAKIAESRDMTFDECIVHWIENEPQKQAENLTQSIAHLEKLALMNLYWHQLPFSSGMPKQKLTKEGLEALWEEAAVYADKLAELGEQSEN